MFLLNSIDPTHPKYVEFPDPELADKHGFVAHGGDLSIYTLLSAYQQGIFPWFNDNQPILWWSPNPRLILPTKEMYVSRSLKKTIRSQRFTVTCGQAFTEVIKACSQPRRPKVENYPDSSEPQTWITDRMMQAYNKLQNAGFAQSIECWEDENLVGGLYGVSVAGMFFGESMFSKSSNSSKVALFHLCQFLHRQGISWIDCQVDSDHLNSLGAINISRKDFISKIQNKLGKPGKINWQDFPTKTITLL